MTDHGLRIRNLGVSFGGFQALQGVDLEVRSGELRFLIGPNGAGKTTLIDVVSGMVTPTTGTVEFEGRSIAGIPEHKLVRRGIGRTFQTPTVFEALTVAQNLDLAANYRRSLLTAFRRHSRMSPVVEEALARVALTPVALDKAGSLSHGQKQWLEIGMLLVQQPRLLLLDELVAGMTGPERIATGELLQELATDHTIIVVEHDMAFLRRFASSVTVLHEGKVLSEGSVAQVQSDPRVREVYLGRSRDERSGAPATASAATTQEGSAHES